MLVLQTVLAALWMSEAPSTVTVEGGTHDTQTPLFDVLEHCWLPMEGRFGPALTARLERQNWFLPEADVWSSMRHCQRVVPALICLIPEEFSSRISRLISVRAKFAAPCRNSTGPLTPK